MRTLLLVLFLMTFPTSAQAQYTLPASTMGAGTTNATSAQFQVQGTVGQPVAGWSQGSSQIAALGFWFTARPTTDNPTPIETDTGTEVPQRILLDQNYPNPFNPTTTIRYGVPAAGPVRLAVYDLLGREVAVLVNAKQAPGTYRVVLDAAGWSSGVYLYRIAINGEVRTRRLTLLK
ncbi:MAG TPA: T9SS type A sorting domain-containing protein [Rhodothermales bacterium]|nr:T9SS type A sorting domain-containing protein [Rhodothermales bacterium]